MGEKTSHLKELEKKKNPKYIRKIVTEKNKQGY